MLRNKKPLSIAQIQEKLARYCAYQDRCEHEVREKLKKFEIDEYESDQIVDFLIDEKYLDEERFTEYYVRGKFGLKKWGKQKIKAHLRQKSIAESLIEKYLDKIDYSNYLDTIADLAKRKEDALQESDNFKRSQKVILYLQQKGFELEEIFKIIKNERPD